MRLSVSSAPITEPSVHACLTGSNHCMNTCAWPGPASIASSSEAGQLTSTLTMDVYATTPSTPVMCWSWVGV